MSSLQKSAMSARLAKLPSLPPLYHTEENSAEEGDEETEARDGLGSLTLHPSAVRGNKPNRSKPKEPNPSLAPLSASTHFAQAVQVAVPSSDLDFRVYFTPPILPKDGSGSGSLMVCHHGAGYSALSFACLAKEVTESTAGECGFLTFDARAHGKTWSISNPGFDAPTLDLSLPTLTTDFVSLISTLFPDPSVAPALILVGHSMGGAVITQASSELISKNYHVGGVAVLDVVEGSALEALPRMHGLLASRPEGFTSPEEAIEWHITGHSGSTIQNTYSARLSVPSLVVPSTPDELGAGASQWKWRTPLKSTAPFWEGWFKGLSSSFLTSRTARLLILAGTDRLDRELMIGQMQGKFQLEVVANVGHMLHEDDPVRVAHILIDFWRRNERIVLPGVKKVGEL